MTRCIIYCRVSTDAQERDGTSLDTQERECIKHAESAGWRVITSVRDAASGFSLERPGLLEVRDLAKRGQVDVILSYALDRLSRKQTHVAILVEEMEEGGVTLQFVTENFEDTATGQLLRSVKAFAAEFEREKIAERTMRGKAERARSGRLPQGTGRGMYGYRYNQETGKREIDPAEGPIVRELFEDFVQGASIIGLANRLNQRGVPTKHGKRWSPATLYHLLRNENFAGQTTYRRTKVIKARDAETGRKKRKVLLRPHDEWINVPDATPAIVQPEVFALAQQRLDDPDRLRMGRRTSTYGLAGHIRCKVCASAMVGQTLRGKFRYYRCRRAFAGPKEDRCSSYYVRADAAETSILREVAKVLSQPEVVLKELERSCTFAATMAQEGDLRTKLDALGRQRERLVRLYQMGEIDDEYLHRESHRLQAERLGIQDQLDQASSVRIPEFDLASLQATCTAVSAWVRERGPAELPAIVDALRITVRAEKSLVELQGTIPQYSPLDEHRHDHVDVIVVPHRPEDALA